MAAKRKQASPNVDHKSLLLAVTNDGTVKLGLPPRTNAVMYLKRAKDVGKLENVTHVLCSPEGELFCVRDGDLYRGPLPSKKDVDWFSTAKRVGKSEWSEFKFIFFDPNGELYGATKDGGFHKGPKPSNENLPWLHQQTEQIWHCSGAVPYAVQDSWHCCAALFFHPSGDLYTVTLDHKLMKGKPPTEKQSYKQWLETCTVVSHEDWLKENRFISFCPDGKLWTVDKFGDIYRGSSADKGKCREHIFPLESGYRQFPFLCFTKDKTISSILSFQFLPERGEIASKIRKVIAEQIYNNMSTSVLKHTFMFDKTVKTSSYFSHEHGFTFEVGASLTFTDEIPSIAELDKSVNVGLSTTHTWNFTETNETEVKFSSMSQVEVEPGKTLRVVASVMKAKLNVPYRARVKTLFGFETEIEGTWHGEAVYNLMVTK